MPGFIITVGATIMCGHGGQVKRLPITPPRVKIMGQPVAAAAQPGAVIGCSLSGSGGPFCATVNAVTTATRIKVMGQPVLLIDSQTLSPQTATPAASLELQTRVRGM